jgi:glutamate-1-semialdehyde 2,1-aminomutase
MSDSTPTRNNRWSRSREYLRRAQQSLAGGVSSPFRAKAPVPLYIADARGSRFQDVDGNQYIDYALAWGPLILGHCHPAVVEAVRHQAGRPHILGSQHELEFEVAEEIQRIVPCAERVSFTSSGSEAVQLALRLARAFTGRTLVVKFEGHYHGWMDGALLSYHPSRAELEASPANRPILGSKGQTPNSADNVLVAPWNDTASLERLFAEHGSSIAAAIAEPVLCNSGCLPPEPGFLQAVAEICRNNGALLVFDEIITGFRVNLGGAQRLFGITPDLATLGKALGGGLPLSAICGRREIMELMFGGGVSFGGTFNGNPLSLAAASATLRELSRDGGQPLESVRETGGRLMNGIRSAAARHGIPLLVTGLGAAFALHFTQAPGLHDYRDTLQDDHSLLGRFLLATAAEGVNILPDGRLYVSTVHSEQDVAETVAACDRALASLVPAEGDGSTSDPEAANICA